MSRKYNDPNRKPWFWGFVGKTALATVVFYLTSFLLSVIGLLLFGGALLGLLGMGSAGGSDTALEQPLPEDFPTFSDQPSDEDTDVAVGPPPAEPAGEVPVVLSATSDVPAEVSWSIGNESATETFTGEWTKEGVTDADGYESFDVNVTPVDYATSTTTCTITVDGEVVEEGTATNDTVGTYCIA